MSDRQRQQQQQPQKQLDSETSTEEFEEDASVVDQMKRELFNLAESIHEESKQDSVIVIGIMDKESATVTKWANCGDVPIIDHLINEFAGRAGQRIESMSSNASMDEGSSSRSSATNRKVDMGCQTTLTQQELSRMEVNSLIVKEQFK